MHLLTDSKSLLDFISKGSKTSEKRITLDIHAASQVYKLHEISNIEFVRTDKFLADVLTKSNMKAMIYELFLKGRYAVKAEQ